MFDYTPENVQKNQMGMIATQLYLIDEKLGKIDRGIRFIAFLGVSLAVIKYKNKIKAKITNPKGE